MRFLSNALLGLGFTALALGADVRTISFSLPEERVIIDVLRAESTEPTALSVRRENFGEVVTLPAGAYKATIGSLGKTTQFVIPPTGSGYILLIFVTKDGPFTIVPIADDTDKIPYQTYHVINALGTEVLVDYNDKQKIRLAPAKSHTFPMPPLQVPNNAFPVRMFTKLNEGDKEPTQFFLGSWRAKTDRRYISLVYKDPLFFKPLVRSIPDFKPQPEGEAESE